MRARFEDWVNGLTGDWCVSRQRFFGVPFPVWYPIDEAGNDHLRAADSAALESQLARRPLDRRARRLRARPAWTAGRLRGRPRRDGHVGDLVADAADRGPGGRGRGAVREGVPDGRAPAGARHHPHLAVLDDPALAPGRGRAAVEERGDLRLGAGPGPQEDVEVQGQRGHADAPARGARRGRGALLGGERAAGDGHGVRRAADEGRATPGGEAPERVEVRARRPAAAGPGPHASARPGADGAPVEGRGGGDELVRGLRLRARAGARGELLLVVLRLLPGAGEGAPLRRRTRM